MTKWPRGPFSTARAVFPLRLSGRVLDLYQVFQVNLAGVYVILNAVPSACT